MSRRFTITPTRGPRYDCRSCALRSDDSLAPRWWRAARGRRAEELPGLLLMLLHHARRLLPVLLLHVLERSVIVSGLAREILVLELLLASDSLPLLLLAREQFVTTCGIGLCIGAAAGTPDGVALAHGHVAGVHVGIEVRRACDRRHRRAIGRPDGLRGDDATAEVAGTFGGCDRRATLVAPSRQFRITAGDHLVLDLFAGRGHMRLACGSDFRGVGHQTRAGTTGVAEVIGGRATHDIDVVDDGLIVSVVDDVDVDVVDGRVVLESIAGPAATVVTLADVAEAVVDAAVEADVRPPVAGVERVRTAGESPEARRPEQSRRRR